MGEVDDHVAGGITRREFIQTVAAAPLAGTIGQSQRAAATSTASRVVLVRDEQALDAAARPRPEVIQKMLDLGICALLDVKRPVDGWRQIVNPLESVGIKSNVWEPLPTPAAVEASIKRRIAELGIPEARVRIDDRGARQTLTGCATLVNARPLRTHHWAGVGGCIKNPIMFMLEPSFYHPDMCADLGSMWKLPILKDKIKLNVLIALTPQFYTRGPHHFDTRYLWPYRGIFLSRDPVAVDTMGVRLLEARRRIHFGVDRPLTELAKHVRIAGQKHGLGESDPRRIDLVRVGWDKETLL